MMIDDAPLRLVFEIGLPPNYGMRLTLTHGGTRTSYHGMAALELLADMSGELSKDLARLEADCGEP